MAFLIKAELKTVATIPLINKLTDADDDIITDIINESISLIRGKLSKFYDVETIFNATGSDRNLTVLKYLKDIVIYEIYERCTRDQNLVAKRRRDEAMTEIDKLNTGDYFDRTLPARPSTEKTGSDTVGEMRFGNGNQQYSSNY